jgi:hypothetical protein
MEASLQPLFHSLMEDLLLYQPGMEAHTAVILVVYGGFYVTIIATRYEE